MTERIIAVDRIENIINVFGSFDQNVHLIEDALKVQVTDRESELRISGEAENVILAEKAVSGLLALAARGERIDSQSVRYVLNLVREGREAKIGELAEDVICVTAKGKPVKAKTLGQRAYCEAIAKNTVTLGVGPAGTGKTYLAVAAAVAAFRAKEVNRIVLTRPAVEAGSGWAFCPGTCKARWTPTSAPSTTRCSTCSARRPTTNIWSGVTSKWPPLPICAGAHWTTASSSWTRPRTPAGSR